LEPQVVVFLASDAAGMVSGATYDVTAGDSARNTEQYAELCDINVLDVMLKFM
jgi:hypothetical protein